MISDGALQQKTLKMRIRITKPPPTPFMDGYDVAGLHVGRVYDLSAAIAEYLVVTGHAVPEMRAADRPNNRSMKSLPNAKPHQ